MELGMIGLGRMGASMVRRLLRAGHRCVVYDLQPQAVEALANEGAVGATSLEDLAHRLSRPRAVWMMVPAAVVNPTLTTLNFADKMLSALRYEFGGHQEKPAAAKGGA
jgi:6-phosphogluconate dehydrogenase